MLFMVSDGGSESGAEPKTGSGLKVELDLDGAPFLDEPEEKKIEPDPAKTLAPAPREEPTPPTTTGVKALLSRLFSSKKRAAALVAGLVLLIAAPVGINYFWSAKGSAPSEAVQRVRAPEPGLQQEASAPGGPLFQLDEFLIPLRGNEGELRLLRCRFAVPAPGALLMAELRAKQITVRDALYYYLSNKPVTLLSDRDQAELLKQDLISVINEHISSEKIQELFIEEYLIMNM